MSKLIQKAGFLNTKRAGRYMNYIATRDGVEFLDKNADSVYMRYYAVWNDLRDTLEATTKANRDNTIHSRSRKNSVPSRTPSFKKRSDCDSN